MSPYLYRPIRTWFEARVARFVNRLVESRRRNPWPWFETPHG